MTNPYETLGVREGATPEEIKAAYRELVKKYHPDRYSDNPLKDLAEDKMREINEAYDYFEKNNFNQGSSYEENGYNRGQYYTNNTNYSSPAFQNVRNYINRNDLRAAEHELNGIRDKNAEWFFLSGVISLRKGWYNQGYRDIQNAVNMDPGNYEYREALNNFNNNNNAYMNNGYYRRNTGNSDFCDTLACFCCADQMCECCGGDLCSCC